MTSSSSSQSPILWHKVIAIALIQGAITLTWVVYNMYLPDLLKQLGLAAGMTQILLIIEHFLEVIIEPIAGNFSDQQERKIGTRLPIITLGVIISATLFLLIPALVIFGQSAIKWLWVIMVIFWASAMAIFRSPVMALLRKSASREDIVQAASLLTLATGAIGALQFDAFKLILKLGAPFAFFLGTIVLLGAGFAIQKVFPPQVQTPEILLENQPIKPIPLANLMIIIGTGITVGLGLKFYYPTINQVLNSQFPEQGKLAMMLFSILLGISALATGKIATKLGNSQGMFFGVSITAIFLLILVFIPDPVITYLSLIILLIAFSFVLNGVFPFIFALVPESKTGFGMGLYFGCFGGAISLFVILSQYVTKITPQVGAMGGFMSLAIATVFVYLSKFLTLSNKT